MNNKKNSARLARCRRWVSPLPGAWASPSSAPLTTALHPSASCGSWAARRCLVVGRRQKKKKKGKAQARGLYILSQRLNHAARAEGWRGKEGGWVGYIRVQGTPGGCRVAYVAIYNMCSACAQGSVMDDLAVCCVFLFPPHVI